MKLNEIREYFDTSLYEMSYFSSDTTGLPGAVKLWVRTEPVSLPHIKYRVKLIDPQKGSAVFALWGDQPQQVAGDWKVSGKDLSSILRLLSQTSNYIRQHIDGTLDTAELVDVFRRAK